ncbi:hypothetical protein FD754_002178 [Muntiacus muntjak]|uniref:CTCK domain-containing protein n=1 Tax=Muntiacus muntjak TaxID=9888 RepID=A0A5N3W8M9_MUNMU|nr:hypothetical protein FD754_002178 [Muntiacus muntjak]
MKTRMMRENYKIPNIISGSQSNINRSKICTTRTSSGTTSSPGGFNAEDNTLASGTTVIPESSNTVTSVSESSSPVLVTQSRLALCDPIDCSPPGSSQGVAVLGPTMAPHSTVTTSTGVKEPSVCFVTHKLIKPNQTNMIDWRHIMATSEARIELTGSGRTRLCQTKNTKNPMNRGAWWATVLGVSKVSGKGVGWWWPAAGLGAQSVASSDKMRSPGQGNRKPLHRAKANRVLPREHTVHSKHPLPTTQGRLYTWTSPDKIKLLTSVGSSKNQESSRKTYFIFCSSKITADACYGPLGEKKSPGDTWTANCYKCTCTDAETVDCKLKECPSPPTCKPEERLVKFKDNDTCCEIGYCEPRTCLFNNNDYEVGASFADPNNPCISYSCHNTGFIAMVQDCPKQTWCAEEDRVYDSTKCCYTCKPNCRSSPVNVTVNYNGCKKKVKMARCTGECKKTIKYDYDLFQLKNSCLCCQEENYEYREIDLDCPDGGTIPYRYRHIITCSCLDICQQSTTSTVS